MPPTGWISKIH